MRTELGKYVTKKLINVAVSHSAYVAILKCNPKFSQPLLKSRQACLVDQSKPSPIIILPSIRPSVRPSFLHCD